MGSRAVLTFTSVFVLIFLPNRALQIVAILVLAFFLVFFLWSRILRGMIDIRFKEEPLRIFNGEWAINRVVVWNRSFAPLEGAVVRDEGGGLTIHGSQAQIWSLSAWEQKALEFEISSTQRGLYQLGPFTMLGGDPAGFFPWQSVFSKPRLVFVYPKLNQSILHYYQGLTGGMLPSKHPMHRDLTRVRSIREYQPGDDTRHIHWKASARSGQLHTSEFEQTIVIPSYVVLNLNPEDYHLKRKSSHFERCIEAAAAVVYWIHEQQGINGFISNGSFSPKVWPALGIDQEPEAIHLAPSDSSQTSMEILTLLAVIEPGKTPIQNLFVHLERQRSPWIHLITPPLPEETLQVITAILPQTAQMDVWFLDEHQNRQGRIDQRHPSPRPGIHFHRLAEYGSELRQEELRDHV